MRNSLRRATAAPFIILLLATLLLGVAPAPRDSSALINEALDKPVEVELKTTLPNALLEIKNRTGVPIELAPGVLDQLPWGDQTHINIEVKNQTLRQAIDAIARKCGLMYVLTPESVELRPMPALQRLGRRATVDELNVLALLSTNPLQAASGAGALEGRSTLQQLLSAVDQRLIELKSPFAVERRTTGSGVKDDQPVSVPRNATIAEALDAIAKETPLAWGPWGHSITVKPKETWVRDQLEKPITRRFVAMDVGQVLSDLADYSGVDFTIEPGALQKVSTQARTMTLELENRSVQQVLELIAGFTGLSWTANEKGVYVWNPSTAAGAASQDPVIAMLPLSDKGIQVMIRQSDVPDDLKQYIRTRKAKALDQLRDMMKAEGFIPMPPASQPTTKPSGEAKDL